ncbi:MAG: hypothetical protein LV481_16040 [Methylacidiphilales bacterium]|nr:hypothetical protein [Candidatus Methylacidiphilales bacterium]
MAAIPEKRQDTALRSKKRILLIATFLIMAGLIFARLGHYALWDDESDTALTGKGVQRTGDTSILLDHGNILAYRGGISVTGFRGRTMPPLPAYLAAASFTLFDVDAFSARLPFALFGLGTVALILLWIRREPWPVPLVLAAGLVGNVSLILFFRQCRYYGPTIFFSVAILFIYWRWKPTPRNLLVLSGLSFLLFASQYLDYIALYLCLGVDYLVWRRREWKPGWLGWLCLFGPQIVLNGVIGSIWNPFRTHIGNYESFNTLGDRLVLYFWYWRDMDRCEFLALPVILLALGVGLAQRRTWLVRGVVALAVYVAGVSLVSPQIIRQALEGEVRYLTPVIPLAIALEAGVLCVLLERRKGLLIVAVLVVFGTNLLNYWPFLPSGLRPWELRSTLLSYLGELSLPQTEPYTPTAQWINDNVPEGKSIWVLPYPAAYPLMFHAPKARYAWQLEWPPRPDFASRPPIDFIGQEPPDYLIAFGPSLEDMARFLQAWNRPDVHYQPVKTIDVYWLDKYRPELYWRNFQSTTDFNHDTEAIYIFQRVAPPPAAVPATPSTGETPATQK